MKIRHIWKFRCAEYLIFTLFLASLPLFQMLGWISGSLVFAVGTTVIYSVMAIGFTFLMGYSGLASLGTAGFVGVGAYTAYFIVEVYQLPFLVAFLGTLLISGLLGILLGFISLRIEGIYLALITLGFSEILRNTFLTLKPTVKINLNHLRLFGITVGEVQIYYLIIFIFTVLLVMISNLIHSPLGRAMISVKNNPHAARAMGISPVRHRVIAFVISAVYASVGGLLYMMYVRNITASSSPLLTVLTSLNILGAVVIGGAKSLWGTIFGVFFIYGIQSVFLSKIRFFVGYPAFMTMVTGVLMILVVMYFPGGFARMGANLKKRFLKQGEAKSDTGNGCE